MQSGRDLDADFKLDYSVRDPHIPPILTPHLSPSPLILHLDLDLALILALPLPSLAQMSPYDLDNPPTDQLALAPPANHGHNTRRRKRPRANTWDGTSNGQPNGQSNGHVRTKRVGGGQRVRSNSESSEEVTLTRVTSAPRGPSAELHFDFTLHFHLHFALSTFNLHPSPPTHAPSSHPPVPSSRATWLRRRLRRRRCRTSPTAISTALRGVVRRR